MNKKAIKFNDKREVKPVETHIESQNSAPVPVPVPVKNDDPDLTNWNKAIDKINEELKKNVVVKPDIQKNTIEKPIPMGAKEIKQPDHKFKLSFIEDYEVDVAKKLIEEHLGFEAPRVAGPFMAVKIFVRSNELSSFIDPETKEKKVFYLPESSTAHDKFRNCVGLVLSQGPEVYKGSRFQENWAIRFLRIFFNKIMPKCTKVAWSRVGDWVVIPRHEGVQVNYRGIPMQYIYDDRVMGVVEDPEHVTRD